MPDWTTEPNAKTPPAAAVKPKNIVVCSDGTGNADVRGRGTNVFKLFEAVELRANQQDPTHTLQVAIYHDGVGTQSFKPVKLACAAFGLGFGRHVRELYTELARVYERGDKIFLFGFSRGAFAVRTLAGLINRVGIVNTRRTKSEQELHRLVKEAYETHRLRYIRMRQWRRAAEADRIAADFREKHAIEANTNIAFLGVWDTVAAIGFPFDGGIATFWNNVIFPFRFPDNDLPKNVLCARQALAIDEERLAFAPELWNENIFTERIQQVWFPGVHSNVGGGYPKQGLSLVALAWLMSEAMDKGLHVVGSARDQFLQFQNATDKLYDSRAGLAGYYAYKPRDIQALCERRHASVRIHISAFERIALGTCDYSPGHIPRAFEVVAEPGVQTDQVCTIVVKAHDDKQRSVHLQAAGRWIPVWRAAQAIFVLATVWLVAQYIQLYFRASGVDGTHTSLSGWTAIGRFFLVHPLVVAVLVASLLMCYLASSRMDDHYSRFWFGVRRHLRVALGLAELDRVTEPKARSAAAGVTGAPSNSGD